MASNMAQFWIMFDKRVADHLIRFITLPVHRHRMGNEEDLWFGPVHMHISLEEQADEVHASVNSITAWTDVPMSVFIWTPDSIVGLYFENLIALYLQKMVIHLAFMTVCEMEPEYDWESREGRDIVLVTFSPDGHGTSLFCKIHVPFSLFECTTLASVLYHEQFLLSHSEDRLDFRNPVHLSSMNALVDYICTQLRWMHKSLPVVKN